MKSKSSKYVFVSLALLCLFFAVITSIVIWSDVSFAARIAFFAFGFGAGIPTGVWVAARDH